MSELGVEIRRQRERAALTQDELARRIGLEPTAVSKIESGARQVRADELLSISDALGTSPMALLEPASLVGRLELVPRAAPGVATSDAVRRRILQFAEYHEVLQQAGIRSSPLLSSVPNVRTIGWLNAAARLSDWALEHLSATGGEFRFEALLEVIESELHVDVFVEPQPSDGLLGAAIGDREFPLVFIDSSQPRQRALFTLAHELGHVLSGDGQGLELDADLRGSSDRERQANAFAASFLMPEGRVRELLERWGRTANGLAAMLVEFSVSWESLVYRLHNLRLIDARGRDALRGFDRHQIAVASSDSEVKRLLLSMDHQAPQTRRHPKWLAARAYEGFIAGDMSIRPYALLVGEDADHLLNVLSVNGVAGVLDEPLSRVLADDQAWFDDSPV
jgi:DNA-binding XRE family transcriptional regulator